MPAADFRLYHGNALDVLAGLLANELAAPAPGGSLLDPDTILIPQPAMKRWLQKTLAEKHGIAANLRFLAPGEFVRDTLAANLDEALSPALAGDALRWRLFATLDDAASLRHPALRPLRQYLDGGARATKAWSLAGELAAAFENYQAWRRDWLTAWDAGADPDDWQAELWRRVSGGQRHRAQAIAEFLARFGGVNAPPPRGLPPRLFVFACLNVSPDVLRVIACAGKAGPLHFYLPSPSRKYWGDLRTVRERLRDGDADSLPADEHPLLAANGRAGRDFIATLFGYDVVQPSGEVEAYAPPAHAHARLLARVQRDLFERRAPVALADDPPQLLVGDRSLQVHACHTRLREVQVLHEQLHALLEADPTLEPRDIAVMAPDIDGYAPHFQAVFGGAAGSVRFLPYALADSGALAASPLADLFLRLLDVPTSRLTANDVLELLALPAVAARYGVDAAAYERLAGWVAASGARWGLTEAHRERLGAPREHAFTWAFGLERLLLGLASGEDADLAGIAPWPQLEGSSVHALDALVRVLRVLARLEEHGRQAQTAARWCDLLGAALTELVPDTLAERSDQLALERLRAELQAFRVAADQAGLTTPIAPEVVRAHFRTRLADADARQPFLTGGITVCRMVPMRLIPFRVICLLGMNEGEFPRQDPAGAINRLGQGLADPRRRRAGDRSLRDDDRFLFLQLLGTASDVLYLSYLGLDPRDGRTREPSVLVHELLDVAQGYFTDAEAARQTLVLAHPLQPFSLRAETDARAASFDPAWRPAQMAAHAALQPLPVFASMPVAAPAGSGETDGIVVEFDQLLRFWSHPPRAYLRQLGLHLDDVDDRLPEVEPFDSQEPRHRHRLRERVLAALRQATAPAELDTVRARLAAEGELAPGAAGDAQWQTVLADVRPYARALARLTPVADTGREFALTLGRYRLQGRLLREHAEGFVRVRIGAMRGRHHLRHGLVGLVLDAIEEPLPLLELADDGNGDVGPRVRPRQSSARAADALQRLLHWRAQGLARPLPFRADAAWEFADQMRRHGDPVDAFAKADALWERHDGEGDGRDAWTRLALRGRDPFAVGEDDAAAEFRQLALDVYAALAPMAGGSGD